jgi:DEAD/DEAH box helicase domain-containing protein
MRSGLAGLGYVLHNLAPLFLMCDVEDLGVHTDPQSPLADKQPVVVLYDKIPAGIGLSDAVYDIHQELIRRARELVQTCACQSGCPSCVGPAGPGGIGGKEETLALLSLLDEAPLELNLPDLDITF